MHAVDEDGALVADCFQICQQIEPAAARKENIKDDDIPVPPPGKIECIGSVPRFAEVYFGKLLREDLLQTLPDDGVVVNNENAQSCHLRSAIISLLRAPSRMKVDDHHRSGKRLG